MFFEGKWYDLQKDILKSTEPIELKSLPAFFITDCMLLTSGRSRLFFDKKTREIPFKITENGDLFNLRTGNKVAYRHQVTNPDLDSFEDGGWRLHEQNAKGQRQIRFPRYAAPNGNEFYLTEGRDNKFFYEDPDFTLIEPIQGLLGLEKNMLCFQNSKTGEMRILVPLSFASGPERKDPSDDKEERPIGPRNFLLTRKPPSDSKGFSLIPCNQAKTLNFLEYTYREGVIFPKDREARTFLSYLYLAQKKELDALLVLEGLGRERSLSEKQAAILSTLMIEKNPNQTPSGIAVALKAGLLLNRTKWGCGSLDNLISVYRNTYDNIPAELRLSDRELAEIDILRPRGAFSGKRQFSSKIQVPSLHNKLITPKDERYVSRHEMNKFLSIYEKLQKASSQKEKNLIIARSTLSSLDPDLKRIILIAQKTSLPLPKSSPVIESKSGYCDLSQGSWEWLKTFNSPPYNIPVHELPQSGKTARDDSNPIAQGRALTSLQKSSAAASRLSWSESLELSLEEILEAPLDELGIPIYYLDPDIAEETPFIWNLQENCVKPYFREIRVFPKSGPCKPLELTTKVPAKYLPSVKRALETVNQEIVEAQELNDSETSFLLKEWRSLDTLQNSLASKLRGLKTSLLKEKQEILALARKGPKKVDQAKKMSSLETSGFLPKVEFESLITCYLKGSYKGVNPRLKKDEIQALDQKIKNFLLKATQAQQIERSLQIEDPSQMAQILQAKMAYPATNDKANRVFLVFEYRANLRIRPCQVDSIRAMLEKPDVALQKMMGGGKTTVITSILLEMIEPGKIPIYIPPDAQFTTQVANLSDLQYKNYSKHIIPMRFTREELTPENLRWILKKFSDAANYQEAIVTTATTMQSLQLEWLSLLDKDPSTLSSEEIEKIPLLRKILISLKENGSYLLDEIDQILNIFTELNFPVGEKVSIDPHYVNLMETIFQLHLARPIESRLGLTRNQQGSFSVEEYKDTILPEITSKLFDQYKEQFGLENHHKNAFMQYVLHGEEDRSLRALLNERIKSEDVHQSRSAELIFLAKGLFHHLLPFVITKAGNKDFGIPKEAEDRRVIPYLGVDSPASTEFAGPYEAACYHFLTALFFPITEIQLHALASRFTESVAPLIENSSMALQDTDEYKTFMALTGASLDKIYNKDPEATLEALDYLKAHPEKRLTLEKEFIHKHVGAHSSYYRSNPYNFCGLVPSRKGSAGVLWNYRTYLEELMQNIVPEKGVEGRIRSEFLRRTDEGISRLYFSPVADVQTALANGLQSNPRKENVRALSDPSGVFKDKSNEVVANEILTYFADNPKIQAVLFYAREEGTLGVPETLKVLRKSTQEGVGFSCEVIEGTSKEALKAKRIDPETTFTYYDNTHCEATDIPQIPDAIGLVLVDSKLLDRDFLQTNLRLRGYLKNQDVDLLLLEDEKKNYPEHVTGREILTQTEVAQAVKSADEAFKGALLQGDHAIRQAAYEDLLEDATHERMQDLRKAFLTLQDISPHALFGEVHEEASPSEAFATYRKTLENQFPDLMYKKVQDRLDALQSDLAENSSYYPTEVPLLVSSQGMQMQVQVKKETTVQKTSEIELEFQRYQETQRRYEFTEKRQPEIFSLQNLLQSEQVLYERPYDEIFAGFELSISENCAYTEEQLLPVFSKKQKSGEQILIVEDETGLKATLLSEQEARLYKGKIKDGLENAWLYLPDGERHVFPKDNTYPKNRENLTRALLEANIFNGNSKYLLTHIGSLRPIITTLKQKELFFRFLELKAVGDPSQKGALERLKKNL